MGNYIVHFNDGSEALAHYGKKGMHWGEWNEETRQRYLNEGKTFRYDPVAGGFVVDEEASKRNNEAWNASQLAERTGQQYDPRTGGVYSKNASGQLARALDNVASTVNDLIRDPGYTLSSMASKTLDSGKSLVDRALGAISDAAKNVGTEYNYLTKGFSPGVSNTDTSSKKFWRNLGYTPHEVDRGSKYPNEHPASKADREARVAAVTSHEFDKYWNSTARKIRNRFGYK